ncbi:MAG: hypothetical protein JNK02_02345 [Planctomycetes bacterium]|nr:hypothetical protein [Planctomycetota bacterium]
MGPRPELDRARWRGLDWRGALRSPRTWGIVARHMIPVAGVAGLGWSGIQAVSLIALDTLAGLWIVVAAAAVVVAREQWYEPEGDLYNAVVGGLVVFGLVAGLMTFAIGVVVFVFGAGLLERVDFEPRELLEGGWVFWSFGGLLLAQAPRAAALLAGTSGKTAKSVFEPRVGYLLRRLLLAGLACSLLSFLWGNAAILGALIVSGLVLAAHEVFGEELHAVLFPEPAAAAAQAPQAGARRRRRRKRGA